MRRLLHGFRTYLQTMKFSWFVCLLALPVSLSVPGCDAFEASLNFWSGTREAEGSAAGEQGFGPVLLIGADGLDFDVIRPLAEEGKLPNMVELMEKGSFGVLLSEREMRSPPLWTTIATGRPRSIHGIYDFITGSRLWPREKRGGKRRLVTSKMRKTPAVWNLVSGADRKVAVIGWLNTWPAEEVNGIMVSPYVALGSKRQVTIKGKVYPDVPHQVYPEHRWEEIKPLIVASDEVPEDLVREFAPEPEGAIARDYPILNKYMSGLHWSLSHTLTVRNIALHVLKNDQPDLLMVYFEGSDSLAHRFWLFRQPRNEVVSQLKKNDYPVEHVAELRENYGRVVDRYYVLLDEVIGDLISALPEGSRVLMMSDHGFTSRTGRYPPPPSVPFTGEHRMEGVLFISGPGIRSGHTIYGATHYHITPTVLDMLDVEADIRFEGSSLLPQVQDLDDHQELGPEPEPEEDDEDEIDKAPFADDEVERLRSLGYVE